jgi:hypothetical protein
MSKLDYPMKFWGKSVFGILDLPQLTFVSAIKVELES